MEPNDQQIIEGLRKKDAATFRCLYSKYGGKVLGYVMKNSGTEAEGYEVLQTTVLKVWQKVDAGAYDDRGKFGQFFFSIAANTWLETLRTKKRKKTDALTVHEYHLADESDDGLFAAVVKEQRLTAIHQALQEIGGMCGELIQLFYLQEIPLKEIAEKQAVEYGALRKRMFDCRNKLKKLVEAGC